MSQKRTFEFTDRAIKKLPVPPKPTQLDYFDAKVSGLALRVSYGGAKTFCLWYGPAHKRKRLTLGKYGSLEDGRLPLAMARRRAKAELGGVASGADPAGEARMRRQAATVSVIARDWIESQKVKGRKSWQRQAQLLARDALPDIGNIKGCDLKRGEVKAMLRRIAERPAPVLHNRVHEVTRAMLAWALGQEEYGLEYNAADKIERYEETPRDRWLSEAELGAYWKAIADEPNQQKAGALRLCHLTAQRQANVLALHADQLLLKDQIWIVPAVSTKTRRTYRVPLSTAAASIIEDLLEAAQDGWLFPNRFGTGPTKSESSWLKNAHKRTCERAEIEDYKLHDARHTFATHCDAMGISRLIWDGILGHVQNGMADLYSGHDFAEKRLECMERWAARIATAAAENVVELKRRPA